MSPLSAERPGGERAPAAGEPAGPSGRTFTREDAEGSLTRALRLLEARVGVTALDTLWLFPARARGRREQGLIVAGCFEEEHGARRRVVTAIWRAERTGQGVRVETEFFEEGAAPRDRLPRIIDGVMRRSDDELGDPRCVEIGGNAGRFGALLAELDTAQ